MRHTQQVARSMMWAMIVAQVLGFASSATAKAPAKTEPSLYFDLQPLTKQQRLDDFAWIVSNFEQFYAPLAYKEARWHFEWGALKAKYRQQIAQGPMSHQRFAAVMQQFVSEVHDAHTSLTTWREATMDGGDMRVATLGFHTARMLQLAGDGVYVVGILPNFFPWATAPLQVGDKIVAIDGRSVDTIMQEDLQPYQTTGRKDSDATILARSLTFRVSTMYPLRPKGAALVTFIRDEELRDMRLDWTDVSLSDIYRQERLQNQDTASAQVAMAQSKVIGRTQDNRWIVQIDTQPAWRHLVQVEHSGYAHMEHQVSLQPQVAFYNAVGRAPADENAGHGVPFTTDGLSFRLFNTPRGLAAIYRVEDFVFSRLRCGAPVVVDERIAFAICDELSGEDYGKAFAKLTQMGVTDLILDLRRNGGGMLNFADNLLRAFASAGIPAQTATVRVNESWLGEFVAQGTGDYASLAARTVYQSQVKTLRDDMAHKRRTSSPVHLQGSKTLTANPYATGLRPYVLIDELCASACDLFAASMQDNALGVILGRQSMGAGGNVVRMGESPHEKLALTQTASLFYRADGSFIENEGVKPDIEIQSHVDAEIWAVVTHLLDGA